MAITGPVFLDLQIITGTNTEEASNFLIGASVGCVIGSMSVGWIYGRWNKCLTMALTLLATSVTHIGLPWVTSYGGMIFMQGLSCVFRSIFSTGELVKFTLFVAYSKLYGTQVSS